MVGWATSMLGTVPGLGGDAEVRPSKLLSGLPEVKPPPNTNLGGLDVDTKSLRRPLDPPPDPEGPTPANAGDIKNFTVPSTVPGKFDTTPPGTDMSGRQPPEGRRTYAGPVTPELAVAAGFSKEEAGDWANLANWITKGESRRDEGAFTELFNGDHWLGGDRNHPYQLGWAGDTYHGTPTSAYGLFQDEQGTWHEISQKYLGRDTRTTPVNQVKGNLLYAAAEYSRRTGGRNLLADFKGGQLASVEANLHSIWPTLGQKYGGGTAGARAGDAAFNEMLRLQGIDIAAGEAGLKEILKLAQQADPLSEELKKHLVTALERSDKLAERYQQLAEKPPVAQTPMEAAGAFAPFLVMLSVLGGLATRRPALGAMNALSGALEGLNQGNDRKYKNSVDLWKTQTDMAMTTFDMQNKSIRNIMDTLDISDREKQHRLTDAFRFWQMDQDLRLARENQWAEIYKRQDQREDRELQRRLLLERTERALKQDREADEQRKRGTPTGVVGDIYNLLYDKFVLDKGREPDASEKLDLVRQAERETHVTKGTLSAQQQRENDAIDEARKRIGYDTLPKTFNADVAEAVNTGQPLDEEALVKKGYGTPEQRELYRARVRQVIDPSKYTDEHGILKDYDLAKKPKFRPPDVMTGQTPTGQVAPTREVTKQLLDDTVLQMREEVEAGTAAADENRDSAKAGYLAEGKRLGIPVTEADFDQLWPPPSKTPTGPVSGGLGLDPQALQYLAP